MPSDNSPATMGSITITGQIEGKYPDTDGVYRDGMKITFTTGDGLSGSVTTPMSGYTVDNVRALILRKIAAMRAVGGITG